MGLKDDDLMSEGPIHHVSIWNDEGLVGKKGNLPAIQFHDRGLIEQVHRPQKDPEPL